MLIGVLGLSLWRDVGGEWWLEVRPERGWRLNDEAGRGRALRVKLEGGEVRTGEDAVGWRAETRLGLGGGERPRGEVEVLLCAAERCMRVRRAIPGAEER
jgi:hypothetical protein